MSRTPASASLAVVRGSTWEDEFVYQDAAGVPIDLTGFQARMQVRTRAGAYGLLGVETLVLDLTTANARLFFDTAVQGRVRIKVSAVDTVLLNPDNRRMVVLAYSLELFQPPGAEPEYVIPLVRGKVRVQGEVTR